MTWHCSYCSYLANIEDFCKLCGRVPMSVWDRENAILFKREVSQTSDDLETLERFRELEKERQKNCEIYGRDWPNI
jgi:hypothetical protein